MKEDHGIQPARNREHDPVAAAKSRRCCAKHRGFFIRADSHGILNLNKAALE